MSLLWWDSAQEERTSLLRRKIPPDEKLSRACADGGGGSATGFCIVQEWWNPKVASVLANINPDYREFHNLLRGAQGSDTAAVAALQQIEAWEIGDWRRQMTTGWCIASTIPA